MSEEPWSADGVDGSQAETLRKVLDRYRAYWPLPTRQAFYQLVKEGGAGLWLDEYANFLRMTHAALVAGQLPLGSLWADEPEERAGGAWEDAEEFVHSEIETFLWGYRRDLLLGQERHVEAWVQKPALLEQVSGVAVEYCVTTATCRRMPTARFMDELRRRTSAARERRQTPMILFFGDYVPGQGSRFLDRVREALRAEGNLWEMNFVHAALTESDVERYDLPESVATRARRGQSVEPGGAPVELEALAPDVLAERVRASIEAQLDMSLIHNQRAVQARESLRLGKLRASILRQIRSTLRDFLPPEEA